MANPAAPLDSTGAKMGMGIYLDGADDAPAWVRILDAAVVADETTKSGAVSVAGMTAHDGVDPAAQGPIKVGGYAKAAAPTNVSADGDRVNAWFLLNGAQATVLTAAGALIDGDATNGLDVDVTRQTGELVDDAAFTPGATKILMAGFEADETATDSVDEGDGGAARMTLDRKVITTPQPHTAGGLSTFNASGADGADTGVLVATAVAVKASAGQLYGYFIFNPNDETCFVNLYNIAQGSVTVGTSNVKKQLSIPAGAAAHIAYTHGVPFDTAITVSATKTSGSNTAPDVGLDVQLDYK